MVYYVVLQKKFTEKKVYICNTNVLVIHNQKFDKFP